MWASCWVISWSNDLQIFPLELLSFPSFLLCLEVGVWVLVSESQVVGREAVGECVSAISSLLSQVTPLFSEQFQGSLVLGDLESKDPLCYTLQSPCAESAGVREERLPGRVGQEWAVSPRPFQSRLSTGACAALWDLGSVLGWFSASPAGFLTSLQPLPTDSLLFTAKNLLLPPLFFSLLLLFIHLKIILLWF